MSDRQSKLIDSPTSHPQHIPKSSTACPQSQQTAVIDSDHVESPQIKRKPGRPTKYRRKYCRMLVDYFDQRPWVETKEVTITSRNGNVISKPEIVPKHLRFLISFAMDIGVDIDTLKEWNATHDEFSAAYACAKTLYKEHLAVCGSLGLFNSHFTQFLAKNTTDWTDKSVLEHEGKIESVHFFEGMLDKAQQAERWHPATVAPSDN